MLIPAVKDKIFYIHASNEEELSDWIHCIEHASDSDTVSSPFNVQHHIHVDFKSETGFTGLPPEWEAMLKSSGITKEEVLNNHEVVINVLEKQSQFNQNQTADIPKTLPEIGPLPQEASLTLDELVIKDQDPLKVYKNPKKIGEGFAFCALPWLLITC